MVPDSVATAIIYITAAGVFVVLVLNPQLVVSGIKLIVDTLSGVLNMGKGS